MIRWKGGPFWPSTSPGEAISERHIEWQAFAPRLCCQGPAQCRPVRHRSPGTRRQLCSGPGPSRRTWPGNCRVSVVDCHGRFGCHQAGQMAWGFPRAGRRSIQGAERRKDAIVAQAEVALSLARHDTAEALRQIQALPGPSQFSPFQFERVILQPLLLSSQGRDREAAALLPWQSSVSLGFNELERGRVAERLGDRETAVKAYTYIAVLWRHADPELQPYVAEARRGFRAHRRAEALNLRGFGSWIARARTPDSAS